MEHPTPLYKDHQEQSYLNQTIEEDNLLRWIERMEEKPDSIHSISSDSLTSCSCSLVCVVQTLEFYLHHPAQDYNFIPQINRRQREKEEKENGVESSYASVHDGRIRVSDDFRSKRKWISGLNLFTGGQDSVFMDRFVEAINTWAWLYAINPSSKAFTVTADRKEKKTVNYFKPI